MGKVIDFVPHAFARAVQQLEEVKREKAYLSLAQAIKAVAEVEPALDRIELYCCNILDELAEDNKE
ncbi:MAG: hypothetical protein KGL39_46570 [Patescibacteria group bacterium]|nr:hypothetical protein [Patescibacteria group bacterium]